MLNSESRMSRGPNGATLRRMIRPSVLRRTTACAAVAGLALGVPDPGVQAQPPAAFAWPNGARAALSLSFDDARESQVEVGLPLFDELKARVTFYVVSGRVQEDPAGWKRAAAAGHEIGSHTRRHPCSGNFPWSRDKALEEYDLDAMRDELATAGTEIEKALGVTPATFAYPCGQTFVGRGRQTRSYVPVVADLFLAGRGWLDEAPNDPGYVDLAQVYGVSMDDQEFEALEPILTQTLEEGAWLVLAGHDIGTGPGRQVTRVTAIRDVIAWARKQSPGVWVDTVAAVASHVQRGRAGSAAAGPVVLGRFRATGPERAGVHTGRR